jgi:hypothetical protein
LLLVLLCPLQQQEEQALDEAELPEAMFRSKYEAINK